jgi:hypothetical protein
MNKYRILLIIAGLVILILFQQKLIMPFVHKIIASDLFLVESKDEASQLPISTPLSGIAFMHCNNYIKSKLGPDVAIIFNILLTLKSTLPATHRTQASKNTFAV